MTAYPPINIVMDDPDAPPRLRGKTLTIIVMDDPENHRLRFQMEVPGDWTPTELEYINQSVEKVVTRLRAKFPFIGERTGTGIIEAPPG